MVIQEGQGQFLFLQSSIIVNLTSDFGALHRKIGASADTNTFK
ncbi:hypothetical protein SLEP1_g57802 [Rubroshorea leprosula]|uniref:Uncharacterized protein n=1 Tax=Rubroshorea leprosula TaxID=152421 RepID=A0AAV5MMB8_9ROSI|nr:hypothetical protein SLEP1_g57802 [Rubroshorea leprosula]